MDGTISERFLLGRGRTALCDEERRAIEDAIAVVQTYPARHLMVRRGAPVSRSTLLLEGFIVRYMDDREGHRQIVAIHVPGDFVDLHGFPMGRLDHDVGSLNDVRVAEFEHKDLRQITRTKPHLTRMLWHSTLLDAAMHREWIFRIGRLDAAGRLAHLTCELKARLDMVQLSQGDSFALPMTQADLGEATGMTGVHVNRVLRQLREDGLVRFQNGTVDILDWPKLKRLGEFDPDYLYPEGDGPA